jgi:hypothetical protein
MPPTFAIVQYPFVETNGVQPGESRSPNFGPWDGFFGGAFTWTVRPYGDVASFQSMKITDVIDRANSQPPTFTVGNYVQVTVQNVGPDPIYLWYLFLGMIRQ